MTKNDAVDLYTLSNVFELLANERRLRAILRLRESDSRMTVRDLAAEIAAEERDSRPEEISEETISRVYSSLLNTHLPRLYEMKVVEYHYATECVVFSNNAPVVETVIDTVTDEYPSIPAEPRA